jgi:hypothetical protein
MMKTIRAVTAPLFVGAMFSALAAGCSSDSSPSDTTGPAGGGTLAVLITDAPFSLDEVKRADVFIVRVDARTAPADAAAADQDVGGNTASTGGWTTIGAPNATVNLLEVTGGQTAPMGQKVVPPGTYAAFRLIIDVSKSSITLKDGTVLTGGSTPGITFPSADRTGLKVDLSAPVTVAKDGTTTVVIDFDLANSFVVRGNTIMQNGLLFKPVIKGTVK